MGRLGLFVLFLLAGGRAHACELVVAAASDLSALEPEFHKALPDCKLRISFASSGTLARQIQAGADFDLFLAANRSFAADLVTSGHADGSTLKPYGSGRIALWSGKGLRWETISHADRVAIANPVLAPYGAAARQALERRGLWKTVEPKLVYGENIRQTLQFARSGNADAAVVAWSLVHDQPGAQLLPAEWHDPVLQTAVIPRRARNRTAAERMLKWLLSTEGQRVLKAHGLEPVSRR